METSLTPFTNQPVKQVAFKKSIDVSSSTDLTLRTREGDLVTLSSNKQMAYSESAEKSRFEDGATLERFSVEARAASQYSLSVQGDLNEEELAAINALANKIFPLARSFFDGSEIDMEQAAASLQESMGEIDYLDLRMEQTTVQSYFGQLLSGATDDLKQKAVEDRESLENELFALENSSIRDLRELVRSVIDSTIQQVEKDFSGENDFGPILESLRDFRENILTSLPKPLENPVNENQLAI